MRRVAFLSVAVLLFALPTTVAAQTLLGADIESGGYGGPAVRFTSINGDLGVMFGGQGAWVVGKTFGIGGAGFGVTTEHELAVPDEYELTFGYGGVLLEYFIDPDKLTHWHFNLILGAGAVSVGQRGSQSDDDDTVFVVEPSTHLGLNVTKQFRVGCGIGYRLVTNLKSTMKTDFGLDDGDLSGPFLSITLRFGAY
jgi:hypothetical protein